ncbi:Oidioi.mRNA.OKI2018_I69.chr1.g903.t1.cds [Oikopleura dioica]|uniref:Oidioi.mRNA.OKI2018_I69.chr1.g903.t1.cds n=1 Tax=Oikopleura dioica TaxID=34765 RepID=A0ABN7SRB4_OIKDI|nr:Oidioi.mRNA.OKI2018_I69.chr1.g903.t1.cds [Oikopleura dioica]
MLVKHECLAGNSAIPCETDGVKIHHTFLEATERKNEYCINTHVSEDDPPMRAMYYKDLPLHEDPSLLGLVLQRPFGANNHYNSEFGDTWILDKQECMEEKCPYIVRAGERPHKGWKRNPSHSQMESSDNWLLFEQIEDDNDDFLWFIETQIKN